ncbi:MAG: zinc ribbon domain-containing protein [Acidobacteria bacterium]|nr:zinc ribbon domain-containing protein [Acidobacteriota bacterium]
MPIYEYRCRACGTRFEKIVLSSSVKISCPDCGGRKVEQQVSAFGIGGTGKAASSSSGSSGCSGCSGRSCATCH